MLQSGPIPAFAVERICFRVIQEQEGIVDRSGRTRRLLRNSYLRYVLAFERSVIEMDRIICKDMAIIL